MTSFTQRTLMNNERVVYEGHLHYFCYIPSIIIMLVGAWLFGVLTPPDITQHLDEKTMKEVSVAVQGAKKAAQAIQDNVTEQVQEATGFLPKEFKTSLSILAHLRATYMGGILMFLGFVNLLRSYITKHTNEYVVTTRKVIFKYGLVAVDSLEMNLDRIEGIKVKQSVLDRLINRGDVLINGVGLEQIELLKIAQPMNFRKAALEALEKFVDRRKST